MKTTTCALIGVLSTALLLLTTVWVVSTKLHCLENDWTQTTEQLHQFKVVPYTCYGKSNCKQVSIPYERQHEYVGIATCDDLTEAYNSTSSNGSRQCRTRLEDNYAYMTTEFELCEVAEGTCHTVISLFGYNVTLSNGTSVVVETSAKYAQCGYEDVRCVNVTQVVAEDYKSIVYFHKRVISKMITQEEYQDRIKKLLANPIYAAWVKMNRPVTGFFSQTKQMANVRADQVDQEFGWGGHSPDSLKCWVEYYWMTRGLVLHPELLELVNVDLNDYAVANISRLNTTIHEYDCLGLNVSPRLRVIRADPYYRKYEMPISCADLKQNPEKHVSYAGRECYITTEETIPAIQDDMIGLLADIKKGKCYNAVSYFEYLRNGEKTIVTLEDKCLFNDFECVEDHKRDAYYIDKMYYKYVPTNI